jgi:formamidopyrimidine-DNA glycosylase
MPELPEVEVTRRGLLPHLPGKTVAGVFWSGKRLRAAMPCALLRDEIQGRTIRTVDRRAKYLLIRMAGGAVLVIHLGMTGRLGIFPGQTPLARHDHLRLHLGDGMELRFNDSRRFGSVAVWPAARADVCEQEFAGRQGIEPLGDRFHADNLIRLARNRRMPVKTFLMDIRLLAGIGNIYANEILFAARLSPWTAAGTLDFQQWQAIACNGREILLRAIKAGGSTIADFIGSSGQPGYFQLQLAVYGRKGEKCPRCQAGINKKVLAGRATFFCPVCQQE